MNKPSLLLLHVALGSGSQFLSWIPFLSSSFEVFTLDFEGHGKSPGTNRPYSIENFSENLDDFINENKIKDPCVFGYSMGGFVALYHAIQHPGKIRKIYTFATKFDWNSESSAKEVKMLNAGKIREKVPAFALQLEERHSASGWETVLQKTARLMLDLGSKNPLHPGTMMKLDIPVCIGLGDHDTMVTLEETAEIFRNLPGAELMVMPATPHPVEKISPERISNEIIRFFLSR